VFTSPASAFQTQPVGTEHDRQLTSLDPSAAERRLAEIVDRGVQIFSEPVHEEITQRIYGCEDNLKDKPEAWGNRPNCARQNFAPKAVIDGTRWNDNPPFRVKREFVLPNGEVINKACTEETIKLPRKFDCWRKVYTTSSEKALMIFFTNRNGVFLNRSHFGDMTFLHSMASRVGDRAQDTKLSILNWAEFTYKVASGSIPPNTMLKNLMKEAHFSGFEKLFPNQEATVENFFLMGDKTYRASSLLKDFAFGTLLHMVEDSFSKSHVWRDLPTQKASCNGSAAKIEKFLVYNSQDAKKHKAEDVYGALRRDVAEYCPHVIDVGKNLVRFYEELKDKQKNNQEYSNWDAVRKYLDESVFELKDPDAEADAGKYGR
jgi:hypothetical protein